ncbi:molecular chaperone [Pseudomonas sp. CR3202]|uniref:fimbrial biogenesis chaperone n=1 Tax=Pseudomonas sp. CR3202 TaxID=3351532 RepID=UPI003BF337D6
MALRKISACLGVLSLVLASHVSAGISLSATRMVFKGSEKEASIMVRNTGQAALVQSWLDNGDDSDTPPPLAVTPPLARIPADERQLLRVLYEGSGMPSDRESVVWLNVQEIPQAVPGKNVLQLAVNQRIKVFFRPAGLPGDARVAPEELRWSLETRGNTAELTVRNPSLYHVSMSDVRLGKGEVVVDSTMIAPGQQRSFPVKQMPATNEPELNFSVINDYGAQVPYATRLSAGKPEGVTAQRSEQAL